MNKNAVTAIYSAAHFFVDLACAFLVFRYVFRTPADSALIVCYNFCAFALQMPLGILLDKFGKEHACASAGCLMIAFAYTLGIISFGLPASIIAGVGNALFHIGGGVFVLNEYKGSRAAGIFVSPGAVGLCFGTILGKTDFSAIFPVISMVICAALIIIVPSKIMAISERKEFDVPREPKIWLAAMLLFTVVILRSFGGFAVSFEWKSGTVMLIAASAAAAVGKATGGFLSDKLGYIRASVISLSAAAVLYIFADNFLCGLAAIALFNMTMPITLCAAAEFFRSCKGFSFGLLTFGLYIGFVPFASGMEKNMLFYIMSAVCIVSMILLVLGINTGRKADENADC
ncbi:MAG: hypothetical protein ACI4Q6_03990 [Huintestinicola sp.]